MSIHPIFAGIMSAHFPALPRGQSAGVTCPTCGADSWTRCDDSFSHGFGFERIKPYLSCTECDTTAEIPEVEL
jgi:predicted RNA-binding Zn-ribbon protein involved in translation (DUF1610 family)